MNAAEWVHMNGFWQTLSAVEGLMSSYREHLYAETGFEDLGKDLNYDQIENLGSDKFDKVIVDVLFRLKAEGYFTGDSFTEDVFLGVQYSDIGDAELAIIERFSDQLNSQHWADKIAEIKEWIK